MEARNFHLYQGSRCDGQSPGANGAGSGWFALKTEQFDASLLRQPWMEMKISGPAAKMEHEGTPAKQD